MGKGPQRGHQVAGRPGAKRVDVRAAGGQRPGAAGERVMFERPGAVQASGGSNRVRAECTTPSVPPSGRASALPPRPSAGHCRAAPPAPRGHCTPAPPAPRGHCRPAGKQSGSSGVHCPASGGARAECTAPRGAGGHGRAAGGGAAGGSAGERGKQSGPSGVHCPQGPARGAPGGRSTQRKAS